LPAGQARFDRTGSAGKATIASKAPPSSSPSVIPDAWSRSSAIPPSALLSSVRKFQICLVSLRLRSCSLTGAFVISPLPPFLIKTACAAGPLCSAGFTPLLRYYGPGRHRLAFDRFPGFAGYTAYLAPPISRWDEDGFSSCSTCPCHRAVPTTPN
jgi:hypothetical protein